GCVQCTGALHVEFNDQIRHDSPLGAGILQLTTVGQKGGVAVIDPIIQPDPANPDVVVTMRAARGPSPVPGPFAGITPDDLSAWGLDPSPFVQLGFLGPPAPADNVPPVTTATVNPVPNALGWNNGTIVITLAASDNQGGSGVK